MENLASNLANSMLVMVIGIVVVFIGLIILIACAVLMSKLIKREKVEKAGKVVQGADELPPEQIAAIAAIAAMSMESDAQLVAVITAALMASEAAGSGKQLVVRSVRKVHNASAWSSAGRQESINF